MSDSNSSAPDTAIGGAEPSMEDILASIRKVIASDKDVEATTDTESLLDINEVVSADESEDDILDLVSFVDEAVAAPDTEQSDAGTVEDENSIFNLGVEPAQEPIDLDIPAPDGESVEVELEVLSVDALDPETFAALEANSDVEIGFDETLDLVMDADASDYVTTTLDSGSVPAQSTLQEAGLGLETVSNDDEQNSIFSARIETEAENEAPETASLADDFVADGDVGQDEPAIEDMVGTLDDDGEDDQSSDDMDLVKSLLSDLMGEPDGEAETADAELNDEMFELDDQDAGEDLAAELTGHDDAVAAPVAGPVDTVLDELLSDSLDLEAESAVSEFEAQDDADEPDLGDIAKIAAANTDIQAVNDDNSDDEVTLEKPELKDQFALLAGAAAVAGASVLADSEEELDAEPVAEPEIETEPELETISEHDKTPEIEEEEPMATRATKNKLVDEDTERETSEVFASLTSAVKEKTKLEESGPPIGDLVQAALQPMLQDWLDKNLKGIVERVVKAEVKRISSGK